MRLLGWCLLLLSAPIASAVAQESVHIVADDADSLRLQLLSIAHEQLQTTGLRVNDTHAWLALSRAPAGDREYSVRPLWHTDAVPTLPLSFDLIPAAVGSSAQDSIRATLSVSLEREVLTAARRLRKGSLVGCDDLVRQFRAIKYVAPNALDASCDIHEIAVALRDISAGEVVRSTDVGQPPAVSAGKAVELSVVTNGISITTTAVALADAELGDHVDVRLQRPARTLRARVVAPGSVQLVGQGS